MSLLEGKQVFTRNGWTFETNEKQKEVTNNLIKINLI